MLKLIDKTYAKNAVKRDTQLENAPTPRNAPYVVEIMLLIVPAA